MKINTLKFFNYIANKTKAPNFLIKATIDEYEMDNFVWMRENGKNEEANEYLEHWREDIKIQIQLLNRMSELFEIIKK